MNIEVKTKITVYEKDGAEDYKPKSLEIESHWDRGQLVVIKLNGHSWTVSGCDLIEAVRRCSQ